MQFKVIHVVHKVIIKRDNFLTFLGLVEGTLGIGLKMTYFGFIIFLCVMICVGDWWGPFVNAKRSPMQGNAGNIGDGDPPSVLKPTEPLVLKGHPCWGWSPCKKCRECRHREWWRLTQETTQGNTENVSTWLWNKGTWEWWGSTHRYMVGRTEPLV